MSKHTNEIEQLIERTAIKNAHAEYFSDWDASVDEIKEFLGGEDLPETATVCDNYERYSQSWIRDDMESMIACHKLTLSSFLNEAQGILNGESVKGEELFRHIQAGNVDKALQTLKDGANPNWQIRENGKSCLMLTVESVMEDRVGKYDGVLDALLAHKDIDINLKDKCGRTALIYATKDDAVWRKNPGNVDKINRKFQNRLQEQKTPGQNLLEKIENEGQTEGEKI